MKFRLKIGANLCSSSSQITSEKDIQRALSAVVENLLYVLYKWQRYIAVVVPFRNVRGGFTVQISLKSQLENEPKWPLLAFYMGGKG